MECRQGCQIFSYCLESLEKKEKFSLYATLFSLLHAYVFMFLTTLFIFETVILARVFDYAIFPFFFLFFSDNLSAKNLYTDLATLKMPLR